MALRMQHNDGHMRYFNKHPKSRPWKIWVNGVDVSRSNPLSGSPFDGKIDEENREFEFRITNSQNTVTLKKFEQIMVRIIYTNGDVEDFYGTVRNCTRAMDIDTWGQYVYMTDIKSFKNTLKSKVDGMRKAKFWLGRLHESSSNS